MSLEKIKTDLENDILKNQERLKIWKNVTYPTKKNGSIFKTISKNFNGIECDKWGNDILLTIDEERNINNHTVCVRDRIYYDNRLKKDTKVVLEEIKCKILARVEDLNKKIESQEQQLKVCDQTYEELKKSYDNMCQSLRNSCGTNEYGYINNIGKTIYQDIVKREIF